MGKFIVFEGCDGAGKTTIINRLLEILSNSARMAFPQCESSFTINTIRNNLQCGIIDSRASHLLFTANRWEGMENLHSKLQTYDYVLVDRYKYSGIAYSVANGLQLSWCQTVESGLPDPDHVIFLDVKPSRSLSRCARTDVTETLEMQKKVYGAYKCLMDDSWTIIDADKPIDEVVQSCLAVIHSVS